MCLSVSLCAVDRVLRVSGLDEVQLSLAPDQQSAAFRPFRSHRCSLRSRGFIDRFSLDALARVPMMSADGRFSLWAPPRIEMPPRFWYIERRRRWRAIAVVFRFVRVVWIVIRVCTGSPFVGFFFTGQSVVQGRFLCDHRGGAPPRPPFTDDAGARWFPVAHVSSPVSHRHPLPRPSLIFQRRTYKKNSKKKKKKKKKRSPSRELRPVLRICYD